MAADLDTHIALKQWQAQSRYHTPQGEVPGEASGVFPLCQLVEAESCCASLPVQLQQDNVKRQMRFTSSCL